MTDQNNLPEIHLSVLHPNMKKFVDVKFVEQQELYMDSKLILDIGRHATRKALLVETLSKPDTFIDVNLIKEVHGIRSIPTIVRAARELNSQLSGFIGFSPLQTSISIGTKGRRIVDGFTFATRYDAKDITADPAVDIHAVSADYSSHVRNAEKWALNLRHNGNHEMKLLLKYMSKLDDSVLHTLVMHGSSASGITLPEIANVISVDSDDYPVSVEQVRVSLQKISSLVQKDSLLKGRIGYRLKKGEDPLTQSRFFWRPRSIKPYE